jgi:hypothetical protein
MTLHIFDDSNIHWNKLDGFGMLSMQDIVDLYKAQPVA